MSDNPFQGGQQFPQAKINLKLEDLTDITCEECGSKYFKPVMMMKRVSPLVSPTGKEQLMPIQILRCDDCGHVNEVFVPK